MPHLSPMSWIFMILVFWTTLMMLMTLTWWTNYQAMPLMKTNMSKSQLLSWYWS